LTEAALELDARAEATDARSRTPGGSEVAASRVLVTGANGHLGQRLLRRLASRSAFDVRARAVVRSQSAADSVRALRLEPAPECEVVDYHDVDGLSRAAEGCTHIVHLVGILKESATTRYTDAHESTAFAVARAAEKAGVKRIVYLSILGASAGSRNPCLASKGRAERILLEREVPTTVIRLPMVLGAGDIAARALRGQAMTGVLPLVRGGRTLEQPIDADDVGTAILLALSRRALAGEVIELAGPESLSHRDLVLRAAALHRRRPRILPIPLALARLAAALAERILANPPITRPMLDVLEHDDRIDPRPACALLGLTLTPLDETLRRTVGPGAAQ
jgi:NADH dehydrogenase